MPDFLIPLWMCKPRDVATREAVEAEDWATLREISRLRSGRSERKQVWELIHAGWRFEPATEDSDPYQWRWRRPGKRPSRPGRLFASTGQAYNALMRERGD